eukprot:TRINITY_DN12458_c0_g1_i1.p1 TRINITY_DN12458_c0_g1~~TRINITY_DN12458_c0_g1_i1.p1  ORF type:complete len:484 (+),score=118.57 TRINITY_DN12458_c0_g1_i1:33-1454(+)
MTDAMDIDEQQQPVTQLNSLLFSDFEKQLLLAQKTVITKENRYLQRSIRQTFTRIRRKMNSHVLTAAVKKYFSVENVDRDMLLGLLQSVEPKGEPVDVIEGSYKAVAPEIEVFVQLMIAVLLIDNQFYDSAIELTTKLVEDINKLNRRTLDPLSAKVFFYFSLAYESIGKLGDIRPNLLAFQRTAVLRHNYLGQVSLLTLILRNYLEYNLYDQASKFVEKVEVHMDNANSNELARYYFYYGKILAVQLKYSRSLEYLQLALRKAPQNGALGFRSLVTKYSCIVQLLLGEIPERSTFRTPGMSLELRSYFELTQVVRSGDLSKFNDLVESYQEKFRVDRTFNLIQRLRHNVIKTGLKKINVSYSRISIGDICDKISLDNVEDAEFIISKAINDGIIDAKLNHEESYAQSNPLADVYTTSEPQESFRDRISFCLQLHNDAVKSMRYHETTKQEKEVKPKSETKETKKQSTGNKKE